MFTFKVDLLKLERYFNLTINAQYRRRGTMMHNVREDWLRFILRELDCLALVSQCYVAKVGIATYLALTISCLPETQLSR